MPTLAFALFAALACGGAAGCAFHRNLLYSACSLLLSLTGVAGLYVQLGADFPAVVQLLVYVGGVLVVVLFAIFLTPRLGESGQPSGAQGNPWMGLAVAAGSFALTGAAAWATPWRVLPQAAAPVTRGASELGELLLGPAVLPFELASLLLLAALVGAVALSRKPLAEPPEER